MNPRLTLRSIATETAYHQARSNGTLNPLLEEPPLIDFLHWRIIANRFPYSMIFKTHHLLIPKRVVGREIDLNDKELIELRVIKMVYATNNYDVILENLGSTRSIVDHYHLHLLVYYDERKDIVL